MTTANGISVTLDLVLHPLNNPFLVNDGKIDIPGSYYGIPDGEFFYASKTKLLVSGKMMPASVRG